MAFLTRKWNRELDYRLIKEIWAFRENRIAVRFAYEWHDDSGNWFRSYGNENWEFDARWPDAAANRQHQRPANPESERKYHWPLGRRPDDHPIPERSGALRIAPIVLVAGQSRGPTTELSVSASSGTWRTVLDG